MINSSVTCPICGAKITNGRSSQEYKCFFCAFERRPAPSIAAHQISHNDDSLFDLSLPFQEDLNGYFREKFQQLKPDDLLHLSVPVKRPFHKCAPLTGQINFFHAKNIMFLLEQHGFKMIWRKNRFSSILKIIARKC